MKTINITGFEEYYPPVVKKEPKNDYFCLERRRWVKEYTFLWVFKIYRLRLFRKRTKWSFRKSKRPMYGPNKAKPVITESQAREMWGDNKWTWPVEPYKIVKDDQSNNRPRDNRVHQ